MNKIPASVFINPLGWSPGPFDSKYATAYTIRANSLQDEFVLKTRYEIAVKALEEISKLRDYLTNKPGKATDSCDIADKAMTDLLNDSYARIP